MATKQNLTESHQELLSQLDKHSGSNYVKLLNDLSHSLYVDAPEKSKTFAKEAIELSTQNNWPDLQITGYLNLANAYFNTGQYGLYEKAITNAKAILKTHPNPELLMILQFLEGSQLYMDGEIKLALNRLLILDQTLSPLPPDHFVIERVGVFTKIYLSHCWLKSNNYAAAIDCLYGAYELAKILSTKESILSDHQLRGCFYAFGRAFMDAKIYNVARDWFRKGLMLKNENIFNPAVAIMRIIIGESYVREEKWDKAETNLLETAVIFKQNAYDNPAHLLYWNHFYSTVMRQKGDLAQASYYLSEAYELQQGIQTTLLEEELLLEKGLIFLAQSQTEQGVQYLQQALTLVGQTGNKRIALKIHQELVKSFRENKQHEKALNHMMLAHQMERKEIEVANKIARRAIEREHEYTKKLKDAEIFRLKNIELAQKNQELQQMNRKNQQLLEERAELNRIALHDLRGPLTAIQLQSTVLLIKGENASQLFIQKKLKAIQNATQKMAKLIDRFLSSDQLEGSKLEPEILATKICPLVNNVISSFQDSATVKLIRIENKCKDSQAPLLTDPFFLEQILVNLLSNAIKYSPQNSAIFITKKEENHKIALSIKDEGLGLTESDMSQLFTKYGRLSAQPTDSEESIGLGLHIAQKLANAIGGYIQAHSDGKDQGSTFTVYLPIVNNKIISKDVVDEF